MSNPGDADATPITSTGQLADWLAAGCKPRSLFRIGTEHEKFGFRDNDLAPPPYEPAGIKALLEGLSRYGAGSQFANEVGTRAVPICESGTIIGLRQGRASISLEPAGQLELSGAPLETLHETAAEFATHFSQVRAVGRSLGLGFAPLGFHPLARREEMPWMPKGRYGIMRRQMQRVGSLGLDMMTRTCTVQVNLDFASEDDMARKLRVSLALQSLATALFANSPFTEGKPNGFLSYRAHVWTDTDNQRAGIPRVMMEPGFDFARHVGWLLDSVPMYFVYRDGRYIDVAGRSFRDFLARRVPELAGIEPTVGDFADHVTTAFPDVRLKRFLEMRGADAGRTDMMVAQSALWVGLLYDDAALTAAEALTRDWSWEDVTALRLAVPREGLAATIAGRALREVGRDALAIACQGLRARDRRDADGQDETIYLAPLAAILAGAPGPAEYWLARYHGDWKGDVRPIFAEAAI